MDSNNDLLVQKIVNMVRDIDNYDFDLSDYSFYKKLSEYTLTVWESSHENLLIELKNMKSPVNTDYQVLWYDSLGFPQEIPKTYNKQGEPIYICYGILPCREEQVVMYHDAKIKNYTFHKNSWHLFINTYEGNKKIIFNDVVAVLKRVNSSKFTECEVSDLKNIIYKDVTSGNEIPAIDYIFHNLKTPQAFSLPNKRYFLFYTSCDTLAELLVIFGNYCVDIF